MDNRNTNGSDSQAQKAAITVLDASKSFGRHVLWRDWSFSVPSGSMTAVTGPSGAGKTTLINCLGLLEDFNQGTLYYGDKLVLEVDSGVGVDGKAGKKGKAGKAAEAGKTGKTGKTEKTSEGGKLSAQDRRAFFKGTLGFLFQNYGLVDSWTVRQNLEVPLKMRKGLARKDYPSVCRDVLKRVGLEGMEKEKIYTLSGGEQQRVALARLMLKKPTIILADEPTSSLDAANSRMVMEVLREFADQGATVLISTHGQEAIDACDGTLRIPGHEEAVV